MFPPPKPPLPAPSPESWPLNLLTSSKPKIVLFSLLALSLALSILSAMSSPKSTAPPTLAISRFTPKIPARALAAWIARPIIWLITEIIGVRKWIRIIPMIEANSLLLLPRILIALAHVWEVLAKSPCSWVVASIT